MIESKNALINAGYLVSLSVCACVGKVCVRGGGRRCVWGKCVCVCVCV